MITKSPIFDCLLKLMNNNNIDESKIFINNENNYVDAIKFISESETLMAYFIPLISKEKITLLMSSNVEIRKYIIFNSGNRKSCNNICSSILETNMDRKLCQEIRKTFALNQELAKNYKQIYYDKTIKNI